jgi:hypothetical protein
MASRGRGGKRNGSPQTAYANRTDLNGVAQADAQRAAPMGSPSLAPAAPLVPLSAPTQRPNEHLMTGVPTGPGAGPEALSPILPTTPQSSALGLLSSLGENVSPAVKAVRDWLVLQSQNQAPQ